MYKYMFKNSIMWGFFVIKLVGIYLKELSNFL